MHTPIFWAESALKANADVDFASRNKTVEFYFHTCSAHIEADIISYIIHLCIHIC